MYFNKDYPEISRFKNNILQIYLDEKLFFRASVELGTAKCQRFVFESS